MSSTHFGYESVDEREKARRVRGVEGEFDALGVFAFEYYMHP